MRKRNELIIQLRDNEEGKICPKCGGALKIRTSFRGPFWGCENYPNCSYTENIDINNN